MKKYIKWALLALVVACVAVLVIHHRANEKLATQRRQSDAQAKIESHHEEYESSSSQEDENEKGDKTAREMIKKADWSDIEASNQEYLDDDTAKLVKTYYVNGSYQKESQDFNGDKQNNEMTVAMVYNEHDSAGQTYMIAKGEVYYDSATNKMKAEGDSMDTINPVIAKTEDDVTMKDVTEELEDTYGQIQEVNIK